MFKRKLAKSGSRTGAVKAPLVRKFILKGSEHVYIKDLNFEAKRSKLILNCESSEAKRS